jgi:hypothetical protein
VPQLSRPLALIALALVATPATGRAQSLWPDSLRGGGEIGLEWVRPTFENGDDSFSSTRGIWILSGRVRASDRLNLVAAIPRIVATDESGGKMMGNPYVGVEFLKPDHTPEFSIGMRLLMADNTFSPARNVGFFGDYDRLESVITHALIVTATGYHEPFRSEDGTYARLRFGATFFRYTGDFAGGNEMYFNYGVRVGRDAPNVRLSAEVTGRWWLNSGGASLAQATTHQGALTASFLHGPVQPYVGIRAPVDEDLKGVLRYVLTFGVVLGVQ